MDIKCGTYIVEVVKSEVYRAIVEVEISEETLKENGYNLNQAIDRELPMHDEMPWEWLEDDTSFEEITLVD